MAKVKLKLDKRENCRKKDGTYPIILVISHKRKTRSITLKYSFRPEDWDQKNLLVKNVQNHKPITAKINSQLIKAQHYLINHEVEIELMDINELKDRLLVEIKSNRNTLIPHKNQVLAKRLNGTSLNEFAQEKILRLRFANKMGYVSAIETSLNALKRFAKKEELIFAEIDLLFLKDFCAYCTGRGNKPNTISAYLRPIKTLFREAVHEEVIPNELNPFPKFKIPKAKETKKRALRIEKIKEIRALSLKSKSALWDARNYFLFMFNNMGINLIDVAQLKKEQIVGATYKNKKLIEGRLEYTRSKNGRQYSIKLTQESIDILNKYDIFSKENDDLIFPIGYANTEKGFKTYKKKRQRINGRIKKLGEMVGIKENLTSYYARHSWATIAKRKMIPISVIAEGLGHADLKTTQIYLDSFDDDVLDDANDEIVS
ncbi:MAG: phage integrase SAM-like domain-containing protein [Crocinitomicaceae bacterium]|nr:phage integrase SAM-like domain-containing protein [Crocinitomicaceae bacterium]